ncbi:MAG: hypothetical protein H0V36_11335 [Chloroflexi bacterium]|nr:hypothetical protein [Chloroflexota bacterium]
MQDLLGRGRPVAVRSVYRVVAHAAADVVHERASVEVGKGDLTLEYGRHAVQDLLVLGGASSADFQQLLERKVLGRPIEHESRGVTFDQRQLGERLIAFRGVAHLCPFQIVVLVLEGMGVFVGHDDPVVRPEVETLPHDDREGSGQWIVESRHLAGVERKYQLLQVLLGRQEA